MTKFLKISTLFISVLFWIVSISYAQQVVVSAIVWSIDRAPQILTINPDSDPKVIARNKTQNYTIYFSDTEKDTVYYTITPLSWYTNPISWTVNSSDYDSASWAYINFTYLAPSTKPTPNPTKVTVTLNDWPNLVTKDINLYIY